MQCKSEGVGNTKCIFRRGGREAPTWWWWLPCYRLMVALSRPWDRVGWYDDNPDTHRVLFICIQMLAHMTQWTGRTLRQQNPETLPSGSPQLSVQRIKRSTLCLFQGVSYDHDEAELPKPCVRFLGTRWCVFFWVSELLGLYFLEHISDSQFLWVGLKWISCILTLECPRVVFMIWKN